LYYASCFSGTQFLGCNQVDSYGGVDVVIAKMDSNMLWQWAQAQGSSTQAEYYAYVSASPRGGVFATGYNQGNMRIGNFAPLVNASSLQDIWIARLYDCESNFNAQFNVVDSSCLGGSTYVTASGSSGCAPYTYQWQNGSTQSNFYVTNPTTLQLQLTDTLGCTTSAAYTYTPASLPTAGAAISNPVVCYQQANGALQANPTGGLPPYNVAWNNGQLGTQATQLSAGWYTFTLTDSRQCSYTDSIQLPDGETFSPTTITAPTNVLLNDTVQFEVENISGATYQWQINGGTILQGEQTNVVTVVFTSTTDASLTLLSQSAQGCTDSTTFSVSVSLPVSLPNALEEDMPVLMPNPGNGTFTVLLPKGAGIFSSYLYDVNGREVPAHLYTTQTANERLHFQTQLAPGLYILHLQGAQQYKLPVLVY